MLEQQRSKQLAALQETCATARVVGMGERTNGDVATTLTMQQAAVAALLATILLSGYMVAVG